jgi:hypothetical protein
MGDYAYLQLSGRLEDIVSLFKRKPALTTAEEHGLLVDDLVSLTKLLGQARQEDILQHTEKSGQKVAYYVRGIEACQVRLIRLSEGMNKDVVG